LERDLAKPLPHPVDRHVGARIRLRRQLTDTSQIELAQALGLSFQQIQKYETGANRVSASMLHAIGQKFGVPPGCFFEGLAPTEPQAADPALARRDAALRSLIGCPDGYAMAALLARLPQHLRRRVLNLLAALVEADRPEGGWPP
jgi:transcriptional regulator with XRE-family HTH domain